jgi:6,7-dimethyl-8-ribityllumazine synthase
MKKIAIIQSEYYGHITLAQTKDAKNYLLKQGYDAIDIHLVPGAVEIPLAALWCAQKGYEGIIVFGCVIQGETKHFDYVCDQVNQGCLRVMMDHALPVIFGVLTVDNEQQALDRVHGPVGKSGKDCAKALQQMLGLRRHICGA